MYRVYKKTEQIRKHSQIERRLRSGYNTQMKATYFHLTYIIAGTFWP